MQVAPAASVPQPLLTAKCASLTTGVPIVADVLPVFVIVTVCCVDALPGTLSKRSSPGVNEMPGSSEPVPLSDDVACPAEVETVNVPARAPVADGEKRTGTKQLAPGSSVWLLQSAPPVVSLVVAKSPVVAEPVAVTLLEVPFVS